MPLGLLVRDPHINLTTSDHDTLDLLLNDLHHMSEDKERKIQVKCKLLGCVPNAPLCLREKNSESEKE
jgi:hypothetical protein